MKIILKTGFVALLVATLGACSSTTENTETDNTDPTGETADTNTDATDNTDNTGDTTPDDGVEPENLVPEIPAGGCYKHMAYDRNGDGEKDNDAIVVFNANGDWVRYSIQDANGNAIFSMNYEYDENYNLVQRTNHDATETITYQENYTYDANGFAKSYDKDSDGDGFIETSWESVNNDDGKRVTWSTDNDGDGLDDAAAQFTYNDAGKLHSYDYDGGADGFTNTSYILEYSNMDDGSYEVVTTGTQSYYPSLQTYTYEGERIATYTEDTNHDGTIDYSQTTEFDADGNVARVLVDRDANGVDDLQFVALSLNDAGDIMQSQKQTMAGEIISTTSYTYNAAGDVSLVTERNRADEITARTVNAYNDNGDLQTQTSDNDFAEENGNDSILTLLYDENGQRLGGEFEALGNQNEAPENLSTSLTWDAEGNVLSSNTDYGNDGDIDQSFEMTFNAEGNVLTRTTLGTGDTNADYRSIAVYGADDKLKHETQDYYADDTTDQVETLEWDDMGNATLYTMDTNGDGQADERWAQEFDTNGFFSSYLSDADNNGSWDFGLVAESECLTE